MINTHVYESFIYEWFSLNPRNYIAVNTDSLIVLLNSERVIINLSR